MEDYGVSLDNIFRNPATRIIRKIEPIEALLDLESIIECGGYNKSVYMGLLRKVFTPYHEEKMWCNYPSLEKGDASLRYLYPELNMVVKTESQLILSNGEDFGLKVDIEYNQNNGEFKRFRLKKSLKEQIPNGIIGLKAHSIICPAQFEFEKNIGVARFKPSDILKERYSLQTYSKFSSGADRYLIKALGLVAEAVYLHRTVEDTLKIPENLRNLGFDDNILQANLFNPTVKRSREASEFYIDFFGYFVDKFPVFMEAAQLVRSGLALIDFIKRINTDNGKCIYLKLSTDDNNFHQEKAQEFFQEADKRLKGLEFPKTGIEKYLISSASVN